MITVGNISNEVGLVNWFLSVRVRECRSATRLVGVVAHGFPYGSALFRFIVSVLPTKHLFGHY